MGANQQTPAVVCTAPKKRRPAGDTRSISAQGTLAGGSLHPTQRRTAQHNTTRHNTTHASAQKWFPQPRPLKIHGARPPQTGTESHRSERVDARVDQCDFGMDDDASRCTTGTMVLLEWPPAVSAPAPRWSIDALSASPSRPQGPIVPRISGLMPLSARSSQLSVPRCRGPLPSHPFPSLLFPLHHAVSPCGSSRFVSSRPLREAAVIPAGPVQAPTLPCLHCAVRRDA